MAGPLGGTESEKEAEEGPEPLGGNWENGVTICTLGGTDTKTYSHKKLRKSHALFTTLLSYLLESSMACEPSGTTQM